MALSPAHQLSIRGARDMIPMLVGAAPFGIIFGALASASGLAAGHSMMMSAIVFAGSSQFIATGLIASHTSLIIIWLTTFIVNLRHALYGASLLPHVKHLPLRWRILLSGVLTDEAYAVMIGHYRSEKDHTQSHWYFLGAAFAMYFNWLLCTLIGVLFGQAFPGLDGLGLDFAMAVTFISIVVPQLVSKPKLLAALVSAVLSVVTIAWPYKLGLMTAITCGVLTGMLCHHLLKKGATQ
ncbi:AzlC family ABC transporter permease [Leeia sp. TBRC 13508]|uniref:AzlC family ABC transporter permease n=1 Tax=Leeia speluncae TaxID=2884804 RepID=A0ABS8D7Z0_9NEIS|nr:AzlC family ABC transporter permease [Leeia speluncae]MCB6184153.1 AzlC family ABC transporter permease [Leeia speluncae]